jgi:hypothetical protein
VIGQEGLIVMRVSAKPRTRDGVCIRIIHYHARLLVLHLLFPSSSPGTFQPFNWHVKLFSRFVPPHPRAKYKRGDFHAGGFHALPDFTCFILSVPHHHESRNTRTVATVRHWKLMDSYGSDPGWSDGLNSLEKDWAYMIPEGMKKLVRSFTESSLQSFPWQTLFGMRTLNPKTLVLYGSQILGLLSATSYGTSRVVSLKLRWLTMMFIFVFLPTADTEPYNTFDGPGFPACNAVSKVYRPSTVEEIQSIVQDAIASGVPVRASGVRLFSRHRSLRNRLLSSI